MESLTRPVNRRKLSNVSGVFSFSSKNAYDDVFEVKASPVPRFKPPAGVEDYGEIFGGGSRGSSIPVLDLSALDKPDGFRSSKLDYSKIFGAFGDEDIAVPYDELVVDATNKRKCSSDKVRNQSDKESPLEGSNNSDLSGENNVPASEASDQSIDCMKQFKVSYQKSSQRSKDGTKIAETPLQPKTGSSMKTEVELTFSFSSNINEENNGRKTETQMPDKLTNEGVVRGRCGSWLDGSHSNDKLFNTSEINLQSYSLKTTSPSSPLAKLNNSKDHCKQSKSSYFAAKANPSQNTAADYLACSDEEIDINSAAAVSAAALKRAIEKAQESIKLAKDLMERQKDGLQGLSKLSSLDNFKVKDRKVSRIDGVANSIEENNAKEMHQRFGNVLQGFTEINRRVTSRSDEVATTFEHRKRLSSSGEVEGEKHQGNVTELHARATWLLDLVNNEKNQATTLASGQIENKNILLPSMNTQACDFTEMRTAKETLERVETKVGNTKSIEHEVGLENGKTKVIVDACLQELEETVNMPGSPTEDIQSGSDEQEKCEKKLSDSLYMTEENKLEALNSENHYMLKESNNLAKENEQFEAFQQVQMGTKSEDVLLPEENDNGLGNSWNEGMGREEAYPFVENDDRPMEVCGSASCESSIRDTQEGKCVEELEALKSETDYILKKSNNLVMEKEPFESFQQVQTGKKPEDVHALEDNGNGLVNSCNGVWMGQEESLPVVENDDQPIEVCGRGRCEKTFNGTQEGEGSNISDIVLERETDEIELIHAYKGEETQRTLKEEREGKEAEEVDLHEKETVQAPELENYKEILKEEHGSEEVQKQPEGTHEKETVHAPEWENNEEILEEEHGSEEVQKQPEETHNCVDVEKTSEQEFDWEEVEKRIKEACINEATESMWREEDKNTDNQHVEAIQESGEAESIQFKAGKLDNNQETDFLQKTNCERDSHFAFDANSSSHEVQEAFTFEESNYPKTNQDAVGNHEDNSSVGASEAFYECEVDTNEGEEAVKEAFEPENKEISETGHAVQSPYPELICPSEMPRASNTVYFDGNGANILHIEMSDTHKLFNRNTLDTADLAQNAEEQNNIDTKLQDVPEAHPNAEKPTDVGSFENSRQKEMEGNIKEPELGKNPESGGDLVHNCGENPEMFHKEQNLEEDLKKAESTHLASQATVNRQSVRTVNEIKTGQNIEKAEKYVQKTVATEGKEMRETLQKELKEKDNSKKIEAIKREREWEKDRMAVERAIREARERAFAEARERAERAAVEKAAAEVRQKVMAEAREKLEKGTAGTKFADKASIDAKLRAERAAVERATTEARERALEKALSQKSTAEARAQTEKLLDGSGDNGLKHSFSSSDLERINGTNSESAQRRKARLERHQRIMERVEKALAEKNRRDSLAEKEKATRNKLAESLDADIKRWASGKEGNLRALLSTLQYILGPDSGWQPIPLSEIVTTAAVKKAYRKATLYVHPDKLQQRGASIQQKYICEKVFDLLKAAWSKL